MKMKKLFSLSLATAVLVAAALAPVSVDLETGEVSTAVAACQDDEGPDCMPKYQWRCTGFVNECNMRFKVCRDGGPTFPPDPECGDPPG